MTVRATDPELFKSAQLYTFIDTAYLDGRDPGDLAQALAEGGSDVIQLRAKTETPDQVEAIAEKIVLATQGGRGFLFVINDHIDVASRVGADAVHLGQEDFFDQLKATSVEELGLDEGPPCLLGLSSHSPAQALRAVAAGASYLGVGPVFSTPTKPTSPAVSLSYVRWAADNLTLPWFAIGGVNLSNLDQVVEAGARRVCVVSAILQTRDPAKACQEFCRRLPSLA